MVDIAIKILWGVIIGMLVIIGILLTAISYSDGAVLYDKDWLCTKQEVIKDAYPQEFECVQYTKKGDK